MGCPGAQVLRRAVQELGAWKWSPGERAAAFIGYLAAPVTVSVLALAISDWAVNAGPWWLAIGVVAVVSLVAASGLVFLLSLLWPHSRAELRAATENWPWYERLEWLSCFLLWPTAGFACVAALLSEPGVFGKQGVLELSRPAYDGSPWRMFEAYLWNLADAVPILKVPRTLNWCEPFRFEDFGGGLLLLAYKVVFIVPVTPPRCAASCAGSRRASRCGTGTGREQLE